jgi:superoxide dismutase
VELPVDELLRHIDEVPEDARSAVRNYGGGHANHSLLWASLSPAGGGAPSAALGQAIDALRTGRDATAALARARRVVAGAPTARDTASLWGGAW